MFGRTEWQGMQIHLRKFTSHAVRDSARPEDSGPDLPTTIHGPQAVLVHRGARDGVRAGLDPASLPRGARFGGTPNAHAARTYTRGAGLERAARFACSATRPAAEPEALSMSNGTRGQWVVLVGWLRLCSTLFSMHSSAM